MKVKQVKWEKNEKGHYNGFINDEIIVEILSCNRGWAVFFAEGLTRLDCGQEEVFHGNFKEARTAVQTALENFIKGLIE